MIPKVASCVWYGEEKTQLRSLWYSGPDLLRLQSETGPRLGVWRYARVRGDRGATRVVPPVRSREAREDPLAGRQSFLYQTLCLLCGATVSHGHGARCGASKVSEFGDFLFPRHGYAASHAAVAALQEEGVLPTDLTVRTNKYLNNVIEQDHRRVKQRVRPMLGFKRFDHAVITITGIELVHQIKKQQFDLSAICAPYTRTPHVWEAVLAA